MNILEIEDVIKGLPDQALVQEAQTPSGQMPQFLVVSEIQRRADMRKRFQNQQQETPQGTIAQQIVQGGIASMGNQQPIQSMPPQGMPQQGMPPQGMPPMPPQGMPSAMQQQPPMSPSMSPPMSPPMMPPAQGMAGGGVVRMQAGLQTPYTGGTEAYQNLIDQALMAGGTSRDIQSLIGGNSEAQAVYNSMRGPDPQTASIPYGEEFDGRNAVVGGSPGYTPYYLRGDQAGGTEPSYIERFSRMMEMNSPNYSLAVSGIGFNPQENLSNRNENVPAQQARSPSIGSSVLKDKLAEALTKEETSLEKFYEMGEENRIKNELGRQQTSRSSIFQGTGPINLFEDKTGFPPYKFMATPPIDKSIFYSPSSIPLMEKYDSMTNDFLEPYLNPQIDVSGVAVGGNALQSDGTKFGETTENAPAESTADAISLGLSTTSPEQKHQKDQQKSAASALSRPDLPDFSEAKGILDQLQGVDYSQFKPDYSTIISEQERRAQKIRDDASKDASAQALIQLGAGLAAGDIASGISKAGQAVSDIRGRGRAEAREEEALARKMQLASDEAGMRLGLAEMEANRAIQLERVGMSAEQAKLQAKADTDAYEFEKTFGISLREIESKLQISQNANYREALSGLIELRNAVDPYSDEGATEIAKYDSQIRSIIKRIAPELASTSTDESGGSPAQVNGGEYKLVGTRSSE